MASQSRGLARIAVLATTLAAALFMAISALAWHPAQAAVSQPGDTAEFWILGVEYKGTAGAGEPYIDEGDKVERYVWVPDTIQVQKGQTVVLHFLGINGGSGHPTTIEHYVSTSFTVMRNQTVTKEFIADEVGVFAIICSRHQPTMDAYLIVEDGAPSGGVSLSGVTLLAIQAVILAATVAIVVMGRWRMRG